MAALFGCLRFSGVPHAVPFTPLASRGFLRWVMLSLETRGIEDTVAVEPRSRGDPVLCTAYSLEPGGPDRTRNPSEALPDQTDELKANIEIIVRPFDAQKGQFPSNISHTLGNPHAHRAVRGDPHSQKHPRHVAIAVCTRT